VTEQTEQEEPVAWGVYDPEDDMLIAIYGSEERSDRLLKDRFKWIPLYTAPPKREPLSRVEIIKLWRRDFDKWSCAEIDYDQFCAVVKEAEKAHGIGVDDE
jgi:hypothetical protein